MWEIVSVILVLKMESSDLRLEAVNLFCLVLSKYPGWSCCHWKERWPHKGPGEAVEPGSSIGCIPHGHLKLTFKKEEVKLSSSPSAEKSCSLSLQINVLSRAAFSCGQECDNHVSISIQWLEHAPRCLRRQLSFFPAYVLLESTQGAHFMKPYAHFPLGRGKAVLYPTMLA